MGSGDLDPRVDSLSRRRRRRSRLRHRSARRAGVLVLGLATVLAAGACAAAGVFVNDPAALVRCDLGSQHVQTLGSSTFVAASDGSRLGVVPSTRNREPVPLARMSPWLLKATVAIEDARFWTRAGALDLQAITRAAVADVRAGRVVEGGSTIPQQLARDRYLRAPAPTLSRKLQEACLATRLEQRHSRRAILQDYLDDAYYGHHAYGVKAAAETYFSRPADRLTMVQAALLAGLPQAPTVFDPLEHPAAARRRRHEVLAALLASGAISGPRARAADRGPLHLRPGARYATAGPQPFFEYARRELIDRVGRWHAMHGGLDVTHDARPAHAAPGDHLDRSLARPAGPAGRRVGRDRPLDWRDPRDVRRGAGPSGSGVQPREPVAPAGGQHVQDVRAGGGDGGGHSAPVGLAGAARADDPRSAVHERHGAVGRAQLRRRGAGHDVAAAGDRVLGEHDLRAGGHEGRPAGRRERRAPDGDPVGAGARLLDHAGAGGRLAARDERRVRDARRPRHPPHAQLAGRDDRSGRQARAGRLGGPGEPRALAERRRSG